MKKKIIYIALILLETIACKKPYTPAAILAPNSYLVVEGVINSGADSTIITLSKTVNLSGNPSLTAISNAAVTVEAEGGAISYPLLQSPNLQAGQYLAVALNLDNSKKYRLHIVLPGSEYASDYVAVKPTPPIDSIGYDLTGKGLAINTSTHDATNNTRYYRWAYEESWRFHAQRNSGLIVKGTEILPRQPDEMIYYCYAGDRSSTIVLGSSEKLQQDVISKLPIIVVPPNSEKLQIRYSILIKQYALTKEGYEFWENLKRNTEQLGSIFDPQPSEINGNLHNITNPAEPVIGYLSITNMQTKRIFISNDNFPINYYPVYADDCQPVKTFFNDPVTLTNTVDFYIFKLGYNALEPIVNSRNIIIGYVVSPVECSDCRVRGTVTAPVFWK